jgi:1,4-alpha-glucan branching enzyme
MNLLPLQQLGTREAGGVVTFGILLPGIADTRGYEVHVKVIHEEDQFLQAIAPREFALTHSMDGAYGDYWSAQVSIAPGQGPGAWGQPGRYIYRYQIRLAGQAILDWIIDPCAREFGIGALSAFTLNYQEHTWSTQEAQWRVPVLEDLVFYELEIMELGWNMEGAIQKLDYLADLGVNCLELMPVSNVTQTIDWGFVPVAYFGVDERFGKRRDFKRFVDAAHQRGLAVIIDAVYGHTGAWFTYEYVYSRLGLPNPFMGTFAQDLFGHSTDWNRTLTQDFFFTVNMYWLEACHVDGFRYDCVPNYWTGPVGPGYADLVYSTYQEVKARIGTLGGFWARFDSGSGPLTLIQCAEQLQDPAGVLWQSYSTCSWQNQTFDAATQVAHGNWNALTDLGFKLGLAGYPTSVTANNDTLTKTALQYIENHDHERFVCNFRTTTRSWYDLYKEGDRSLWYKLQPYLIGLLTSKGIPMLWEGQELVENYWLPTDEQGRINFLRPVRWEYFYDLVGQSMMWLVRALLRLRKAKAQFRRGDHYFYNDVSLYQSQGLLLFSRQMQNAFSLVALNFSDRDCAVPFTFPRLGTYQEELHGVPLSVTALRQRIDVPSNYGRIWTL